MEIRLENLEFFAYHGCFEEEQKIGTYFSVDVAINYDGTACEKTDNLQFALNYQTVYEVIKSEMMKPSKLLEHVVYRIIQAISETFSEMKLENIYVGVSKLNPALAVGGKVGKVTVSKRIDLLPKK